MATKYWTGDAVAVAQVSMGSIDSVDATPANNTFTVTIGDQAISAVGNTDVATTATNLRASLNASTHPYFSGITWSGTGGDIIGTADTAGVPFVAALTETGAGTGTVTDFAATTANAGPNDWGTADNWSDGAVPVSTDGVILEGSSVSIVWGLDQNAVTLAKLEVRQSYTGKLGLRRDAFATSADAATVNAAFTEYRQDYLKIGADAIEVGEHAGAGAPAGSGRVKIDNVKAGASVLTVHNTASAASETGQQAIRYLAANAGADVIVRSAIGGVGVATDTPGETATVGTVDVVAPSSQARVQLGDGVTVTTWRQAGGVSVLSAAGTVMTVAVNGGDLSIEGAFLVTTLNVEGGVVNANNVPAAGNAIGTLNLSGGIVEMTQAGEAQAIGTLNLTRGAELRGTDLVTVGAADVDGTISGDVDIN